MHPARHQHVLPQKIIQWLQQFTYRAGPASQRGTAQLHALAAVYFRLTIVRCMLGEFLRDDTRQQAGAGIASFDGF